MPGIAGIISNKQGKLLRKDMELMIGSLMHEPFYRSSSYINERLGIYAGAVAHASAFSDCMPVFNESKDVVLLFSGETFADKALTRELRARDHVFDPRNASCLVHLYEEDEAGFFERLNGWYSGIIVDIRKAKLVLFNDRYGMQRVYVHENKEEFIFASEAKAILKIRPSLRKLDSEGVGQHLYCGSTLGNRTLFQDVSLLPGGSTWTFRKAAGIHKRPYVNPHSRECRPVLPKEVFYRKLKEKFRTILPRYFEATDRCGISLTAGLDTRMILACGQVPEKTPCYTFAGPYRDSYDVVIAKKIAGVLHYPHETVRLDNDFFSNFSRLAEKTVYVTDGCYDICGAQDIYLSSKARKIAPIRISGKFGGEVLRSIRALGASPPDCRLLNSDYRDALSRAGTSFSASCDGPALSHALFKAIPKGMYGCLAAEQSQITFRSPFMDNDLVDLLYQAPADALQGNDVSLRLIRENHAGLSRIATDRGVCADRPAFLSRLPLLYYWTLFKLDWYYGVGMPGWLSRAEAAPGLRSFRKLFAGTHRIDHYRLWFKNEIGDYVRQMLLDRTTLERPWFNRRFLLHMVESHMKGSENHTREINKALTLELIHRTLLENH